LYDYIGNTGLIGMYTDKFIRIDGIYYYLGKNGELVTNNFVKWRAYNFYANSNGELNVSILPDYVFPAFDECVKNYN
jgi:hypothetical protein